MKIKKIIVFVIIALITMTMFGSLNKVKADTGELILNIKMLRKSGYGYQLANSRKNIWKIYEEGGNADDTIYCLKGGPGFGSNEGTTGSVNYTQYFNLKDPDNIPTTYKEILPDGNNYKALLWILDNCYVPAKTNATTEIIEQAAQNKANLLAAVKNYAISEGNPDINAGFDFGCLTDDDIDAVQQLAVWYYTNEGPEADDPYHVDSTFSLYSNAVSGTDGNYQALSNLENGAERATACQALFDYLVEIPQKADFEYTITDGTLSIVPVQLVKNLNVTVEEVANRKIIGPYKIVEETDEIDYYLENAKITDKNDSEITDVIYLNADTGKTEVAQGTTIKDLVGREFYISIPATTDVTELKFTINGYFYKTTLTYWSVANPDPLRDQPVVLVEKTKQSFNDNVVSKFTNFDLALRKFIVSVSNTEGTTNYDRVPQVNLTTLNNGTFNRNGTNEYTATYTHPKNAIEVKKGDKVLYTIRVYNEGNIDGYATEVTDYLPDGLEFIPASESTINTQYGWINPSNDGKTITTDYLKDKLITAFDGANLAYKDLQIECKVVAEVTSSTQSLKNIAEITAHKDKDGNITVIDRDSTPKNVTINNYGTTSQEDDDDFELLELKGKIYDLSLRKFITSVSNSKGTKNYDREPSIDITPLNNGSKTAIYNHTKTPVNVLYGDIVTYTIRVYNEGEIDGYVTEITDHLPEGLEFIVDDELNAKYAWKVVDARTVKTDITSPETTSTANRDEIYAERTSQSDKVLLKAFNGTELDYIDVQIRCRVKQDADLYKKITNIAQITGFTDNNGNTITDRDSQKGNVILLEDSRLPNYKDAEIESGKTYIEGQEDDDDFEKLILQIFDLSLRKFITAVNEKEITNRVPVFNKISDTEYEYVHPKDPVEVANGNTVVYTLRIFNEGNVSGYASEVKDDLPEGLEFLPDSAINTAFRWKMYKEDGTETNNVSEASYIKTDYLSKENEKVVGNNLIDNYDPKTMSMPDYKDLKIAFKVTEPNTSDRIIINTAEIANDTDEEGKPVDDIDSTPNNNKENEDDIDIEKIKVKYFDLSLKKWVTETIVTLDGKTTVTKTGHTGDENPEPPVKVEIRSSNISKTKVKFRFSIKVTNEGEIAGYVKELIDYIPEGLKFEEEDNPLWREEDGKVLTDQLKETLIEPGQSETVEIVLTWINGKDNMGLKTNWAEIYEDDNEYDSPDIDSTPGNEEEGEDDIDEAPVILSASTGSMQTYTTLILISVSMLAAGVVLIKKYVIP